MLKVNEYGGRQAKGNEKRQCFKGWETLVNNISYKCKCIDYFLITQAKLGLSIFFKFYLKLG